MIKISEFFKRISPRKKGGFRSINYDTGHSGGIDDSDELISSQIELRCINTTSQSSDETGAFHGLNPSFPKNSGMEISVQRNVVIVPSRSDEYRVYNSTTQELSFKTEDNSGHQRYLNDIFSSTGDENIMENDSLTASHSKPPSNDERDYNFDNRFRNLIYKRPFLLALVLGITAFFLIIGVTTIVLLLRFLTIHTESQKVSNLEKDKKGDLNPLLAMPWPLSDINSFKTTNDTGFELPKDFHFDKLYNITEIFQKKDDDKRESEEIVTTTARSKSFILLHPNMSLEEKIVNSTVIQDSIDEVKKEALKMYISGDHSKIHTQTKTKGNEFLSQSDKKLSPSDTHQYLTRIGSNNETQFIVEKGFLMEQTYRAVVKRLNLTKEEAKEGWILLNGTIPKDWCSPIEQKHCDQSLYDYRSYDGSCNNYIKSNLGAANQPYRRILFPAYNDGISEPRINTKDGLPLPSAREVSLKVHIDEYREDPEASLMLKVWAQFIEHDLMNTATSCVESSNSCCETNSSLFGESECFPISIPTDDPFYRGSNKLSSMSFVRSAPHFKNCRLGPREQFNQMTSFLDASNIYGTSQNQTLNLRSKFFGRLITFNADKVLLPLIFDPNDPCNLNRKDEIMKGHNCFNAGDPKVNKEATLTSLHTVWVRHHNHLAGILSSHNPHWDDEKIFQETRQIVIAQIQHITYNEFLSEILPKDLLEKAELKLLPKGYYTNYDNSIDPTVSKAFETVFQFSQSMVQGLLKMVHSDGKNEDYLQIHKLIMNPFLLWTEGNLDAMLRGASTQPAARIDSFISGQLTHHYHQNPQTNYGLDVAALIIQKGRDHGLPPYVEWRKSCGFPDVRHFEDLHDAWDEDALNRVVSSYKSVLDVDLFTGMLSEKVLPGGKVGPTIACILSDQFSRLRKGDRFWYEGDIYSKPFTLGQLKQIRATTLSRIICNNGDDIRTMAIRPMLIPSRSNPIISCMDIPRVTYGPWKEKANKNDTANKWKKNNESKKKDRDNYAEEEVWDNDSLEDYLEHKNIINGTIVEMKEIKVKGILVDFSVTKGSKNGKNKEPKIIIFNASKRPQLKNKP